MEHGVDQQRAVLERVLAESLDFLAGLPSRPVNARADVDLVSAALGGPLPDVGADPLAVIDELVAGAEPGVVAMPSPRFFGWVIGGTQDNGTERWTGSPVWLHVADGDGW